MVVRQYASSRRRRGEGHKSRAAWLERSAEGGWPEAQELLSGFYFEGREGLEVDFSKANAWAEKAAAQGMATSEFTLGLSYLQGKNLPKSMAKAVYWFHRGAEHGDAQGQNSIGYSCETGDAGYVDLVEASMWYRLAVAQGDSTARINLDRLEPRLTSEQRAEGEKRATALKVWGPYFPSEKPETPNQVP